MEILLMQVREIGFGPKMFSFAMPECVGMLLLAG